MPKPVCDANRFIRETAETEAALIFRLGFILSRFTPVFVKRSEDLFVSAEGRKGEVN